MNQQLLWKIVLAVLLAPLPFGVWAFCTAVFTWLDDPKSVQVKANLTVAAPKLEHARGMVEIPGGRALVGSTSSVKADRLPAHEVQLEEFWIDTHPVTNRQFAEFINATGYKTTAERRGSSLVFDRSRHEWREVAGASWRAPDGPRSSLVARQEFPVVHVSWHDATAYAAWAGVRLLTEAEYEYAARGGLLDRAYAWGDELPTADQPRANYWQGRFPERDLGLDGFRGLAPVGQFPPNRFGLYDMAGNVSCWCHDWYAADYYAASPRRNPTGPATGTARVLRGGSYLSSAAATSELRVDGRGHAPPHHTASNVGFRCASSSRPVPLAAEIASHSGDAALPTR